MYTGIKHVKYLGNNVTKDDTVVEKGIAPSLRGKTSSLLSLSLVLPVDFFVVALCQVEAVAFYS